AIEHLDRRSHHPREVGLFRWSCFASGDIVNRLAFAVGQDVEHPAPWLIHSESEVRIAHPAPAPSAGWEVLDHVVMVLKRETILLEIVLAGHPPGRLTGHLHGWQKQGYEHADDCNHHQQFDQSKTDTRAKGRRADARSTRFHICTPKTRLEVA